MRKLKLDLDSLDVQSFPVVGSGGDCRGAIGTGGCDCYGSARCGK